MASNPGMRDRVFRKAEDLVAREVAGETIVVPIRGKLADMRRVFALNPVARHLWDAIDGRRAFGELCESVLARFDAPPATAEAECAELIGKLLDAGLIEG